MASSACVLPEPPSPTSRRSDSRSYNRPARVSPTTPRSSSLARRTLPPPPPRRRSQAFVRARDRRHRPPSRPSRRAPPPSTRRQRRRRHAAPAPSSSSAIMPSVPDAPMMATARPPSRTASSTMRPAGNCPSSVRRRRRRRSRRHSTHPRAPRGGGILLSTGSISIPCPARVASLSIVNATHQDRSRRSPTHLDEVVAPRGMDPRAAAGARSAAEVAPAVVEAVRDHPVGEIRSSGVRLPAPNIVDVPPPVPLLELADGVV
jgi:hypothetical protein